MIRYAQAYNGKWMRPKRKGYRMACCDCGLVHRVEFALKPTPNKGRAIFWRTWRDDKATAARRKRLHPRFCK